MSASATKGGHKEEEEECGLVPNVMTAQPNIGGTLCESFLIPLYAAKFG